MTPPGLASGAVQLTDDEWYVRDRRDCLAPSLCGELPGCWKRGVRVTLGRVVQDLLQIVSCSPVAECRGRQHGLICLWVQCSPLGSFQNTRHYWLVDMATALDAALTC